MPHRKETFFTRCLNCAKYAGGYGGYALSTKVLGGCAGGSGGKAVEVVLQVLAGRAERGGVM